MSVELLFAARRTLHETGQALPECATRAMSGESEMRSLQGCQVQIPRGTQQYVLGEGLTARQEERPCMPA